MTARTKAAVGDWASRSLSAIMVAIVGYLAVKVLDHEKAVAQMQGDRFTAADGLEVWKAIGEIQAVVSSGVPPKWLIDRLDRMDAKLDRIDDEIRNHRH